MKTVHALVLLALLAITLACGAGSSNVSHNENSSPQIVGRFISLQELPGGQSQPFPVTLILMTLKSDGTWTMAAVNDPQTHKPLDTNFEDVQLSPDGTKIVFTVPTPCTYQGEASYCKNIGIADASGQNAQLLTHNELTENPYIMDFMAQFSPDGQSIIYVHEDISGSPPYQGHNFLLKMNLDGSNVTPIVGTQDLDIRWPTYSPDGKVIVFARGGEGAYGASFSQGIWTINADGTDLVQLTIGYPPAYDRCWDGYDTMPAYLGSGQRIIFTRHCELPGPDYFMAESLFSVNPDGSGLTQLFGSWIDGQISFQPRTGPNNTLMFSSNMAKLHTAEGFDMYYIGSDGASAPNRVSNNNLYDAFSLEHLREY